MTSWARSLREWATGDLDVEELAELADRIGTVEHWIRAEAILAAGQRRLGPGAVSAEREGRLDLLVGHNAAEFKVVWNNKNVLAAAADVNKDWKKLACRKRGQAALVVFMLFYSAPPFALSKKSFYKALRKGAVPLQASADQDFPSVSRYLADVFVREAVPRGIRPTRLFELLDESGRWFGVWVQPVR